MSAAHYHLDNLIAVVDYNKVMAKDFVWQSMGIEPLADKWRSFGWETIEIDGHDVSEIARALYSLRWDGCWPAATGRPGWAGSAPAWRCWRRPSC